MILAEGISPETPDSNLAARCEFQMDVIMLCHSPNGKERTEKEYKALAKELDSMVSEYHVVLLTIVVHTFL